jgi:hypothetical protein
MDISKLIVADESQPTPAQFPAQKCTNEVTAPFWGSIVTKSSAGPDVAAVLSNVQYCRVYPQDTR